MTVKRTDTQYAIIYNLYNGDELIAHLEKKIAGRDAGKSKLYNYTQHTAAEIRKIINNLIKKTNNKGELKK